MSKVYVLYHSPCMDGTAAAMVAKGALKEAKGLNVTFVPCKYGDVKPEIEPRSVVYFLDYSWPAADLAALVSNGCSVIVIDHHKTAIEDRQANQVEGVVYFLDAKNSGAVLAHKYFYGAADVPGFLLYIQNRDLWLWNMDGGEEFSAWLSSFPCTIEQFEECCELFEHDPESAFNQGSAILRSQRQAVDSIIASCAELSPVPFDPETEGVPYMLVNSAIHQSEIGAKCLEIYPEVEFVVVWYANKNGAVKFSLRSRKGGFDVAKLCQRYGGGGHQAAAGFSRE